MAKIKHLYLSMEDGHTMSIALYFELLRNNQHV